jgi:hypothetical protein
MGETAMDGLSDRGSTPLSSTMCIHFRDDINLVRVHNNFFNISSDDASLLFRTFIFYPSVLCYNTGNKVFVWGIGYLVAMFIKGNAVNQIPFLKFCI